MAAASSAAAGAGGALRRAEGGFGWRPSEEDVAQFDRDGFLIVKGLLTKGEVSKIIGEVEREDGVTKYAFSRDDGAGGKSRMALWNHPGDDLTGHVSRNVRIVESMEKLLGIKSPNELYHYHTKLIMKNASAKASEDGKLEDGAGRFAWHDDYGYWYMNGCLVPEMATVMIALDRCHKGNGCLEVLKGSHKAGRIEHTLVGEQTGADVERVEQLKKRFPLVHVELEPGDACFFHCNLLHQSGANRSADRRWCFLVSFNSRDNDPVYEHHHPKYTPLKRLPEDSIDKAEPGLPVDPEEKDFMVPVTYVKDGVTLKVAEQWQRRDGDSGGVSMTSTGAAKRAAAERSAEEVKTSEDAEE